MRSSTARRRTALAVLVALLGLGLTACQRQDESTGADPDRPPLTQAMREAALHSVEAQLEEITEELARLAGTAPWVANGRFAAPEHDEIEHLFFQYLSARDAMHDLAAAGEDARETQAPTDARAYLTTVDAALAVAQFDGRVVEAFEDDPVAVDKLNEAFPRSEIPRGSFEDLVHSATDEGRIRDLEHTLSLHDALVEDARASGERAAWAALAPQLDEAKARGREIDGRLADLVEHEHRVLHGLGNALEHHQVGDWLVRAEQDLHALITEARAEVFTDLSRIRSPNAYVLSFDEAQKAAIREALQPGDILLSYTAGYLSDVFIPGAFKHSMVWLGGPEERAAAGIGEDAIELPSTASLLRLRLALDVEQAHEGGSADLVEAVAEGVKYSHLDHILDTHVNRLAVLRPPLEDADRAAALSEVLTYVGVPYDFRFDFEDASAVVCSELVQRGFDRRGPISFPMATRLGKPTFSPDDIARMSLAESGTALMTPVLLAEEDTEAGEAQAALRFDAEAGRRMAELLADEDG